ncbi:MAG: cyclic nucleotide-binding domain-containing protein, partial [Burkholderiales bacterium]
CTLLSEVELFNDFDRHEIESLSNYVQAYSAQPGCVVFEEGGAGNYMCVLLSGRVEVYKDNGTNPGVVVSTETRGRTIGEMALIDGERRSATCIVTEAATLALLTKDNFARITTERPAIAVKLLLKLSRLLSRRLRVVSGRLVDYLEA